MSRMTQSDILEVIKTFPDTFGLRAFDGVYHINPSASYEVGGEIRLYVFTEDGLAFSKGSPDELRREVVRLE
jgi:hypothetical protein